MARESATATVFAPTGDHDSHRTSPVALAAAGPRRMIAGLYRTDTWDDHEGNGDVPPIRGGTGRDGTLALAGRQPLAVLTLTSGRHLLSANQSARRLLRHRIGLELDGGRVRCTAPNTAREFASLVAAAGSAARMGDAFLRTFEVRYAGIAGRLEGVIAAHPVESPPCALVVVRSRA